MTHFDTIRSDLESLVCCGSKDCPKDQAIERINIALTAMETEMKDQALDEFVAEVNRRAENNMLKTGKLEGSHYAAMTQIMNERKDLKTKPQRESRP